MPFVPIQSVKIPPRQRTEIQPAAISQLAASISSQGLLHPIHIDDEFNLISGETRLKAVEQLSDAFISIRYGEEIVPLGSIPCVWHLQPSPLQSKEIELAENIDRTDLPWPDRVRALADLHSLRLLANPAQTYIETAKEIAERSGSTRTPQAISAEVSRALITAKVLGDKEILAAGSEKLAFNAATRKLRNDFATELARRQDHTGSLHRLIHGDAIRELQNLAGSFRVFILDPPYGIEASKFGNAAAGRHEYNDQAILAEKLNLDLLTACTLLATPDAHLWTFCDVDLFLILRNHLEALGWKTHRTPITWDSGTSGHIPSQKIGIRRNSEFILFATRDGRGLSQILDDVIRISSKGSETHGAAKPTELYRLLLSLSGRAGDCILDPTCGSGTIFRAGTELKMKATGIEIDPKHAENCEALLAELSLETED